MFSLANLAKRQTRQNLTKRATHMMHLSEHGIEGISGIHTIGHALKHSSEPERLIQRPDITNIPETLINNELRCKSNIKSYVIDWGDPHFWTRHRHSTHTTWLMRSSTNELERTTRTSTMRILAEASLKNKLPKPRPNMKISKVAYAFVKKRASTNNSNFQSEEIS